MTLSAAACAEHPRCTAATFLHLLGANSLSQGVCEAGDAESSLHAKFKQYDRLRFVVVVLNYVRGDTAPLLTPGECVQIADHLPSTSAKQEGAVGE